MSKYCHLKLDGHQLIVESNYAWTKNFIDLREQLEFVMLPHMDGFKLHGELWAPGYRASAVKTLIKERSEHLRFTCWGVEGLPIDMPLEEVWVWCYEHKIDFAPWWLEQPAELPEHAEGYVFKDGNLLNYRKWKPVLTVDAVVTGIKMAKPGKFFGMVGALVVSVEGQEIANVSGMDDDVRASLSPADIGRVVEVAYQYVGSKGRLRHPRFERFRDDKLPSQCTLDQL